MNIFLAEIRDNKAFLNESETQHCTKVLRKGVGDEIMVMDGKGSTAKGIISSITKKETVVEISGEITKKEKHPYYFHLAIAPTKQIDRIEWMIEKAVEIGIDKISFIRTKNSERTKLNIDRIKSITESATKQSGQTYLPEVNDVISFSEFLKENLTGNKLIAYCGDIPKKKFSDVIKESKMVELNLLIGPEGDFTPEEVSLAKEQGYGIISLGDMRLRTETAGLYSVITTHVLTNI